MTSKGDTSPSMTRKSRALDRGRERQNEEGGGLEKVAGALLHILASSLPCEFCPSSHEGGSHSIINTLIHACREGSWLFLGAKIPKAINSSDEARSPHFYSRHQEGVASNPLQHGSGREGIINKIEEAQEFLLGKIHCKT